jgi:hypothetical protein
MEHGLISVITQYKDMNIGKTQELNSPNRISQLNENNQLEQLKKEDFSGLDAKSKIKEHVEGTTKGFHELVLTNMNFGYNEDSKDFYVRTVRGNVENQYPTADMMKLKAYLMSLNEAMLKYD